MAHAEIKEVLPVDYDQLFDVICRYEDYPQFIDGCTSVSVTRNGGKTRAQYRVSLIKDVQYTLDHDENRETGRVQWELIDSDIFKVNRGFWQLKKLDSGKTEAHYCLEAEFKIPVPSLILNKLIKGNLPQMMKNFEKQAIKTQKKS